MNKTRTAIKMIDREFVLNAVQIEKLIVIVRGVEKQNLIPLTTALYDGGIRLMEITYSADGKVSDQQVAENIRTVAKAFDGKMIIGAGTVLTEKQVELTAKAGGKFIISPDVCEQVIKKTKELNMVSIPGALTPTEIQTAHKFGADFIKLFPVASLGAKYVKAIKAPLSHVKLLAVGGINENNIDEYFDSGVCGFGIGANIIDKNLIENQDWAKITRLADKYVKAIKG